MLLDECFVTAMLRVYYCMATLMHSTEEKQNVQSYIIVYYASLLTCTLLLCVFTFAYTLTLAYDGHYLVCANAGQE